MYNITVEYNLSTTSVQLLTDFALLLLKHCSINSYKYSTTVLVVPLKQFSLKICKAPPACNVGVAHSLGASNLWYTCVLLLSCVGYPGFNCLQHLILDIIDTFRNFFSVPRMLLCFVHSAYCWVLGTNTWYSGVLRTKYK